MSHYVKFNVNCTVRGKGYKAGDDDLIDSGDFKTLTKMQKLGVPYVTELDMADEPSTKERIALAQVRSEEEVAKVRAEVREEIEADIRKEIEADLRGEITAELLAAQPPAKTNKRTATKAKGEES